MVLCLRSTGSIPRRRNMTFDRKNVMDKEQIVRVGFASGILLTLAGIFLPWGSLHYGSRMVISRGLLLGIELPIGNLALVGCILAIAFFIHKTQNQKLASVLMLTGILLSAAAVLAWFFQTQALAWSWEWRPVYGIVLSNDGNKYAIAYGAYITLVGATMSTVTISFLRTVRNEFPVMRT